MRQVFLKTTMLLGAIFCLTLFYGGAAAEIPMPDEGVTIILRAPMHHLQVVKQVKGKPAEIISGLEVPLPKNTPILFKVDQVNTVLYKVQITATEEISRQETGMEVWQQAFQMLFAGLSEKYQALFSFSRLVDKGASEADEDPVQQVIERLKSETQQAEQLVKELDGHLNSTEKRQFYTGTAMEVNAGFARIKKDAKETAKKVLGLSSGTSSEIRKDVAKTHQAICEKFASPKNPSAKSSVSKESFDTTVDLFTSALAKAAAKLEKIEKATWQQEDTRIRILKNKLKFTCVITLIAPETEADKSKRWEFAVIVNPESWGILISPMPGILVSTLRDESYVVREKKRMRQKMGNESTVGNMSPEDGAMPAGDEMPDGDEIPEGGEMPAMEEAMPEGDEMPAEEAVPTVDEVPAVEETVPGVGVMSAEDEMPRKFIKRRGSEDDYTISGGALIHVYCPDRCGPLALSGGVAIDGNKNLQVALGASLLFRTGKEQLLAFTFGTIVGRVKRLDGYKLGDLFADDTPPTKLVYRRGWFGALTYNFKFDNLLGSGLPDAPNN